MLTPRMQLSILFVGAFAVACADEQPSITEPETPVSADEIVDGSSRHAWTENQTWESPSRPFLAAVATLSATAANVGYYRITVGAGTADMVPPITTGGHTPILLTDVTAADLAGIDVLFIDNPSNGSYGGGGGEFLASLGDVAAWVSAGGVMVFHDRYVTPAETVLPGGAGFDVRRDFVDDSNIDVLDNTTYVTSGPGGIVDNSTLDGGTSSSHGFAVAGTLPGTGAHILSRTASAEIVTFSYCLGRGGVVYSTIPLDYYLTGSGPPAVMPNFRDIYAPNVVHYGAEGFCVIEVDVDIKPWSDPNSINCTNAKGVIAVAILTTGDFDALTVDHTTVTFEGASEAHINRKTGLARRHEEDVDLDGDMDLVFHFRFGETSLTCGSTQGSLTGETYDGTSIEGADAVRMVGG